MPFGLKSFKAILQGCWSRCQGCGPVLAFSGELAVFCSNHTGSLCRKAACSTNHSGCLRDAAHFMRLKTEFVNLPCAGFGRHTGFLVGWNECILLKLLIYRILYPPPPHFAFLLKAKKRPRDLVTCPDCFSFVAKQTLPDFHSFNLVWNAVLSKRTICRAVNARRSPLFPY